LTRLHRLLELTTLALRRPRLIPLMGRAAWRFRSRGWQRRFPFLPVPPAEYLEWRLHTAYREPGEGPAPVEVERYLRWLLRMDTRR
jgi:hypothetical protein